MPSMKLFILSLLAGFVVVACTGQGSSKSVVRDGRPRNSAGPGDAGTAGDGGGGIVQAGKSEQLVKEAITDGFTLFADGNFYPHEKHGIFRTLANKYYDTKSREEALLEFILAQGDHSKIIKQSKISYSMDDCLRVDKHKHAAVSDFKIGATICFNLKTLQELPPTNLYSEIVALLAHEYMHILGKKDEADADLIQKMVQKHWSEFQLTQTISFRADQMYLLQEILRQLHDTVSHYHKNKEMDATISFERAHSSLGFFMSNVARMADSTIVKLADRSKFIELKNVILLLYYKVYSSGYAPSELPEKIKSAEEIFCGLAEIYFDFEKAMFLKSEMEMTDKGEFSDKIVLDAKQVEISCEKVPAETFDTSIYNDMISYGKVADPDAQESEVSE